jgi:hypothetical protein
MRVDDFGNLFVRLNFSDSVDFFLDRNDAPSRDL